MFFAYYLRFFVIGELFFCRGDACIALTDFLQRYEFFLNVQKTFFKYCLFAMAKRRIIGGDKWGLLRA